MSDLISRQDAIEAVEQAIFNHDSAIMRITELPSADRPTGEWIIHDEVKNIYGGIYIECSECGTRFVTQTLEDEHFCRNCGAKMFKGGEKND